MHTTRDPWPLALLAALVAAVLAFGLSCGAGLQRTARDELIERGFENVTVQPLKRAANAFSFSGDRSGVPCRGEIEIQKQMGQTLTTVTDHCGEE